MTHRTTNADVADVSPDHPSWRRMFPSSSFGPIVVASLLLPVDHGGDDVAIDGARIGRYKSLAAAATTAATIGSHSKPGWRVTVMKSFTP